MDAALCVGRILMIGLTLLPFQQKSQFFSTRRYGNGTNGS